MIRGITVSHNHQSTRYMLPVVIIAVSILMVVLLTTFLAAPLQAQSAAVIQDQPQDGAAAADDVESEETIPDDIVPPFDPPPPKQWVSLELELLPPEQVSARLGEQTQITVMMAPQLMQQCRLSQPLGY